MHLPFGPAGNYSAKTITLVIAVSFISIAFLAFLDENFGGPFMVASYGATAVLVFGVPDAAFSRPRNVFFGHLFSAVIGVSFTAVSVWLGIYGDYEWLVCASAVSAATVTMMLTGTVHPPGGATALSCVLVCATDPLYIVKPVMLGIAFIIIVAFIVKRFFRRD